MLVEITESATHYCADLFLQHKKSRGGVSTRSMRSVFQPDAAVD